MLKIYVIDSLDRITDELFVQGMKRLPQATKSEILSFRKKTDQIQHMVSALLQRSVFLQTIGVENPIINRQERGKPFLRDYPLIHYNLSHCNEGCAMIIADRPVGIDIQEFRSCSKGVLRYACCTDELVYLGEADDWTKTFIQIWTIKEAYLKMTGTGITSDLKSVNSVALTEQITTVLKEQYYLAVSDSKRFSSKEREEDGADEINDSTVKYLEFAEIL